MPSAWVRQDTAGSDERGAPQRLNGAVDEAAATGLIEG